MSIQIKKENSWWDKLLKRNFVPFDYYRSSKEIVNYNPRYLSIYFNLKNTSQPSMHSITHWGEHKFHDHLLETRFDNMLPEFDCHERRPWFIIDGQSDLLAKLQLSGDDLRALQGKEIAFYFYEPLFQVNMRTKRWPAPYGRNDEVVFPELEWLEQFVANHGHTFTAVAHVCDYRLKENYLAPRQRHESIRVKTWDLFVLETITNYYWKDLYQSKETPAKNSFAKKFICPNYRYEGIREAVVSYLLGSDYGIEGHISFFFDSSDEQFHREVPFSMTSLSDWPRIRTGRGLLKKQLPLVLDTQNNHVKNPDVRMPDLDKTTNLRPHPSMYEFYHDVFLAVVNETRYLSLCGEISEKVLLPIRFHRPFVLVGAPYMLRYLRELGFETFSDFWDESYDEIEDHEQRLTAVLKVIDSLLSRPMEELRELYERLTPVLERNRAHLLHRLRDKMYEDLRNFQREQK